MEAKTHHLTYTGVLRHLVGRNAASVSWGACRVERMCPCSALVLRKHIETFYPFLGWGDGGFSDGGKGVLMASGI